MFVRSFLVAGLFFLGVLNVDAQSVRPPKAGPGMVCMQGQNMQAMQNMPGMQQQMRRGMKTPMMQGMPGMQGMQGMQSTPLELVGTIEAIGPGRVQIADDKGNKQLVFLSKQTIIKTTGEATPEFLRPGICVEFKAEVDGKGNIPGKVEELSVVTPSKDKPAGFFPEGSGEAGQLSSGKKGAAAAPMLSNVLGMIKSVKTGKYQLQAGRSTLLFELSENPKIAIETADGAFAQKGDKIEVKGIVLLNMPNQVQAQSVTITLSQPLGEKKKGESGKSDLKRPAKALKAKKTEKTGKSEGLPAPTDEK
jgi:hypothetical protein